MSTFPAPQGLRALCGPLRGRAAYRLLARGPRASGALGGQHLLRRAIGRLPREGREGDLGQVLPN